MVKIHEKRPKNSNGSSTDQENNSKNLHVTESSNNEIHKNVSLPGNGSSNFMQRGSGSSLGLNMGQEIENQNHHQVGSSSIQSWSVESTSS